MLRRYTRSLSLLPVGVFAALALVSASPAHAAAFADTAGASYEDAVAVLVEEGVVEGCDVDQFCPGAEISRGQFASVLVRALELPASETDHFGDDDGSTHEASIDALAESGITVGCEPEAYCPGDSITRAQMASLLARAFALPPAEESFFDDVDGVHAGAVDQLAVSGITAGCSASLTSFCPDQRIPRWQAAVFVARSMGLMELVELAPLDERRIAQAELDAAEAERLEQARLDEQARLEEEALAARAKIWDDLAQCESNGNWSINTGNGYYGGLQFSLSSWRWVGGSGYPHQHSREEQIARAEILLSYQGWGAWPACSLKLNYR